MGFYSVPRQNAQMGKILSHLKEHGHITPVEAFAQYQCFRLAARIYDLRERGYKIETHTVEADGTEYAKYIFKSEES